MILNVTLKPQINFASIYFFLIRNLRDWLKKNQKFEGLVLLLNQHNVQNTFFSVKMLKF